MSLVCFPCQRFFVLLLACLLPAGLHAADSARKAMAVLAQSVPPSISGQLVAVVGFDGQTEPDVWRFLVRNPDDPESMLEFLVRDSSLQGPRVLSPDEAPQELARPLPLSSIQIDSHDVARIIDDEIILEGVEFARLDYQLCWRDQAPEPTWMATLVAHNGQTLGHLILSAQSGSITHRAFYHDFPRLPVAVAESPESGPGEQEATTASPENPLAVSGNPSPEPDSEDQSRSLFRKRPGAGPSRLRLPPIVIRPAGRASAEEEDAEKPRSRRSQQPPFFKRR